MPVWMRRISERPSRHETEESRGKRAFLCTSGFLFAYLSDQSQELGWNDKNISTSGNSDRPQGERRKFKYTGSMTCVQERASGKRFRPCRVAVCLRGASWSGFPVCAADSAESLSISNIRR